jgi:hypothetical protein
MTRIAEVCELVEAAAAYNRWGVTRYAPAVLVAALLVATGVAFLYTESLKLETSPIRQTRVTKLFSPVCNCQTSKARIAFRLAKPDVVSVSVIDRSGSDVRRLVIEKPARRRVAVLWNGRDDAGRIVPDGLYRARVRLDLIEKTYTLPNLIRVDTNRPGVRVLSVRPRVFSPDGDRRSDRIDVRYRVDQPARGTLYVDGVRRVVGSSLKPISELEWYGKVDGVPVAPGRYGLTVVAVDRAGNRSLPVSAGKVTVRYVEIAPAPLRAKAGGTVRVRVSTDARRVSWRIGSRSGTGRPPVFRVRVPNTPGGYVLVVSAAGYEAGRRVVVMKR